MKKIYMILAAMALLSMSLNAQTKATITVASNDFSDASLWTIISDNLGNTWNVTDGAGYYHYSSSYAADDWLVTSPIALQAGKTYTFKIDTKAESATWPEKLEVKMATANSAAALSSGTSIIGETTISNTSYSTLSNTFTVPASGNYYFGIHCISDANQYNLYVDNLVIEVENTDPLIIASPTSVSMNAAPGGTATETVTVTGDNLTSGITATLDDNSVFSVSPASLGATGGELTVTYSPTTTGDHTATLTLTSAGADPVTINLTGSCVAGTTYDLVTDPSTQFVDGQKYIIVHGNYAMGALNTSGYGTLVAITDNGDNTVTVPGTASAMVLTLHDYSSNYTSGYSFQLENGNYLRGNGSSYNGYYLSTVTSANDYCSWTPVADVKSTGGYGIKCSYSYDNYRIGYRENGNYSNFGFYTTNNLTANSTSYFYGLLYVEVDNTPKIEASPETLTINDSGTNNTFTVQGSNLGTDNVGVTVPQGSEFSTTTTDQSWGFIPNNGSISGTVTVTYGGRALSATETVTATNNTGARAEVTVNYRADLYIVGDFGSGWDFSTGTPMTYDATNNTYTANVTVDANNLILFARKLGESNPWNSRLVFGPNSDGDWLLNGDNGNGNIDLNDDDPIKIVNPGTYTITINASDNTFTIERLVPALTAPTDVNVGTNEGAGASTTIDISGNNLTEDLTVSVSGEGFSVTPTTLTAADVMAGATVTVTYNGTNENATGTLTISSSEASTTVNLTASYVYHTPELTAPTNNSTVNVGTNTGSGVSKTINIKGNYLTQDLTVSVSGTGFTVSRNVNVTAAEANAGQDIIVTYNGTNENATGTLTISSSEVSATVNLTASYADNGEITVADGTTTDMYLPVYGSYYEQVQMNQMIYPASMLTNMEGKYITSITFYPASGTTSGGTAVSGIAFSGGKVMLSLGSTTNNSFTSNAAISATVEQVAEIDDVQADQTLTAWTFTFDTPYLYEGGNLLLQVDTEAGSYYRTFFYGTTMSNMGRHQCSGDGGNALHNFLPKATFTYSSTAPLPPAVEGGLLRLHLLFCDQLKEAIPDDNSHEDAYGYVLRYEPQGEDMQESGRVRVNIQKTDCEVLGYYTLDQIDLDKNVGSYDATTQTINHDEGLTMDVITAQVKFDLSSSNDKLNYYYLQGKENGYPELDKDYLSQLHRQEDFTYREMYDGNSEFDQVFDAGTHYYFNGGTPILTGHYGNANEFVSYAPSVTTWGIQRRYFELDGKDNTYGAPVWKTSVGMVTLDDNSGDVTLKAERQTNANNSVNWTGSDGKAASVYILDGINAVGKLPHTNLTKVEFEPYMFRVFVESKNGKLRPYKFVEADPTNTTQPGEHFEAADGNLTDADTHGPICVWSGYIKYETDQNGNKVIVDVPEDGVSVETPVVEGQTNYIYHKVKVDRPAPTTETDPETGETTTTVSPWTQDKNNAMFGALDEVAISGYDNNGQPILNAEIDPNDLTVFVRFYYNVKGMADGHEIVVTRAGEAARPGNGSESPGYAPEPWTAVNEVVYNGEVVSRTYVNALGMQSDEPFDGVNIVVTRYSDGKVSTTKVVH